MSKTNLARFLALAALCLPLSLAAAPSTTAPTLSTSVIANDASTGTTLNKLAKLTSAGAAVITATTDTDTVVGVVVANAGTTGSAVVAASGVVKCVFDGTATDAHFVQISSSTGGDCHDSGAATRPTSGGQVIGYVVAGGSGTGTYTIALQLGNPSPGAGSGVTTTGSPTAGQLALFSGTSTITGTPRTAVYVCDIQSQSATTCANGSVAGANNGTFTPPAGLLYLEVELVGGGGPGGGAGGTPTAGTAGGNTCWNTSGAACTSPVFQASGGAVGTAANTAATSATGGAGGVCNVGSGTVALSLPGNAGDNSTSTGSALGGHGGMTPLFNGGGPGGVGGLILPTAGTPNTGGGGGAGGGTPGTTSGGGGGGSGCNLWAIISGTLASTYTYAIGAAGVAGTGSTIQSPAGGGLGRIVIRGYYN